MTWLSGLELVHSPRSWDMFKSISPHSSLRVTLSTGLCLWTKTGKWVQ